MIDRLRLPVVTTASKREAQEDNQTVVEDFIAQRCAQTPGKHTVFAEFYDRFQQWLGASERYAWSKNRVGRELPVRHKTISGTDHAKFVPHLTLKPAEKEKP